MSTLTLHPTTIGALRRFLRTDVPDSHFFDRGTMQFFKSIAHPGLTLHPLNNTAGRKTWQAFFVTSEQFNGEAREYRVRHVTIGTHGADYWSDFDTIGAPHATLAEARAALRAHVATLPR